MTTTIVSGYIVLPDGYADLVNTDKFMWTVTVERTDWLGDQWAVRSGGCAYDREGNRDREPLPSSRTKRWLKAHRFTLVEALALAERVVTERRVCGDTAQEASDRVAARLAATKEA